MKKEAWRGEITGEQKHSWSQRRLGRTGEGESDCTPPIQPPEASGGETEAWRETCRGHTVPEKQTQDSSFPQPFLMETHVDCLPPRKLIYVLFIIFNILFIGLCQVLAAACRISLLVACENLHCRMPKLLVATCGT